MADDANLMVRYRALAWQRIPDRITQLIEELRDTDQLWHREPFQSPDENGQAYAYRLNHAAGMFIARSRGIVAELTVLLNELDRKRSE